MPEYPVKEPLRHDGKVYAPGDTVEMSSKQAEELIDIGVLLPGGPGSKEQKLNANNAISAVKAAENIEALEALAKGEERKSVLAAIEARRKELSE